MKKSIIAAPILFCLTSAGLGQALVIGSSHLESGELRVVPLALETAQPGISALQFEVGYDTQFSRLEDVQPSLALSNAEKGIFWQAVAGGETTATVLIFGATKKALPSGPLAFLLFRDQAGLEIPRIRVSSLLAADGEGNAAGAIWVDEQMDEPANTFVASGRDGLRGGKSIVFLGRFRQPVDVYLRRIRVAGDIKEIEDLLLEQNLSDSAARHWRLDSVGLSERVLLLAVAAGADPCSETDLVKVQDLGFTSGDSLTAPPDRPSPRWIRYLMQSDGARQSADAAREM